MRKAVALGTIVSLSLVAALSGASSASRLTASALPAIDVEEECSEYVPASYALPVEGDLAPITVDVMVVHDGVSRAKAEEIVTTASDSYEPLGIRVRPAFTAASFEADRGERVRGVPAANVNRLLRETKALFGGSRPRGFDVVHTLTDKNIYIDKGDPHGLLGMADCIGGVRFPKRAFAVSETTMGGAADNLGYKRVHKTMAHELGHLLGARHEHSNCAQGPERHKCTLMFNVSTWFINSNVFGAVESAVVRGFAEDFAQN